MGKLEVAVCFGCTSFGVNGGVSVDGLHTDESIMGLLLVECGGRTTDGPTMSIEGDYLLRVGLFSIVALVPSFKFTLEIINPIEEFRDLSRVVTLDVLVLALALTLLEVKLSMAN